MAESFFALSDADQRDVLDVATTRSGRPAHLLEKDIRIVWALEALFRSHFGQHLVFKGGTSLSKAYKAIDRFSEDVDLTYDIRAIASDLVDGSVNALPHNRSQERKWTRAIRERVTEWIQREAQPLLAESLATVDKHASLSVSADTIAIEYAPLTAGTGYVSPIVRLEFGARSTGEPWESRAVTCDVAEFAPDVTFPRAMPQVMKAERTFWEKATSIHVYCVGGRFRNTDRFSRHWHDLTRLNISGCADRAIADPALALQVAQHKQWFFSEQGPDQQAIDYAMAVNGAIRLVPEQEHYAHLADDYRRMVKDGLLVEPVESFDQLIAECQELQDKVNEKLIA